MLRAFLGPLAVTFPVALFVLDMQFLWVYADDFIGKGLEGWVILKLMFFASARIVNLALPMAVLVASIMALGNLAERNELTAMKSAGMPLMKILRPLVALMMLISCGALWFSNSAWPTANVKFRAILYSVTKQRPALNIRPGIFYTGIEGFAIRVEEKELDGTLKNILIHDHRNPDRGASRVIRAESGRMYNDTERDELVLELINGASYEDQTERNVRRKERLHPHVTSTFESQILRINLGSLDFDLADEGLFKRSYEMMSLPQLKKATDSLDVMVDIERAEIVQYGRKAITLLKDSIILPTDLTGIPTEPWMAALSRVERNNTFATAKNLTRNQVRGVENYLEKIEGKLLRRDRHSIEWHRKFILAISCLVLFFVGAPLGALIRKGGLGLPIVAALIVFLIYYIISMVGEEMVKSGTLSPALGMWLSTMALIPVATMLTYYAMKGGRRFIFIKG
jgi:lipopolysaccharide export system permease protein